MLEKLSRIIVKHTLRLCLVISIGSAFSISNTLNFLPFKY